MIWEDLAFPEMGSSVDFCLTNGLRNIVVRGITTSGDKQKNDIPDNVMPVPVSVTVLYFRIPAKVRIRV